MAEKPLHVPDDTSGWPSGVSPISMEELGQLGIDRTNRLFWQGRPVQVRNRLDLTGLQKLLAVIVSICAILGGMGGFITGLNNASVFLCARGLSWLSCPTPPH